MINIALKWIQTDLVCSQALAILRTIAVNTDNANSIILEPVLTGLPIFILALGTGEEIPTNIEHNKRLGALMQLFRALVRADTIGDRVVSALKEETIYNIFGPILGKSALQNRANHADISSIEAVNMYVNTLSLVDELAKKNTNWIPVQNKLLNQK